MSVFDIPTSEYVTSDEVEINTTTNTYTNLSFHHVSLGSVELSDVKDLYHYVDGYLIGLGDALSIIEVDNETKDEMLAISQWTEDDHA